MRTVPKRKQFKRDPMYWFFTYLMASGVVANIQWLFNAWDWFLQWVRAS